ncbi:ricin-type beta-trefoil lectin domain protein [Streptomyces sp. NPDC002640]
MATLFLSLWVQTLQGTAAAVPPADTRNDVSLVDIPEAEPVDAAEDNALDELTTGDASPPKEYDPTATAAPADPQPASAAVDTLTAGELVPIGNLPVEVGAPADATAEEAAALEGTWQAAVAPQAEVEASGLGGMVFTVTPPADATGEAAISVDYTRFAELYGAGWANRLDLVQFPSCFLTTPDVEGCSDPVEVDTEQSVAPLEEDVPGDGVIDGERRITATIDVSALTQPATAAPTTARSAGKGTTRDAVYRKTADAPLKTLLQTADSGSSPTPLAMISGGSGSQGDFSATPLASSGTWSAGGSSGAFTYTYGLTTPTVPAGPSPNVSFGYNSQVVDGRTSSTNNQASWVGDGWDYNPGSITRTYKTCTTDREGGNNAERKTADLCWGSYNAVMTLGGTTTELVRKLTVSTQADVEAYYTANGDGTRVELLRNTGVANGDADGEYWRVTTRDGSRYYFGKSDLTETVADNPVTNSALTVPVAGNQPGEPCYAAKFEDSFCHQAWRWNLDYVVDVHGNSMSLWWEKEKNYYAKNNAFKKPVVYDRAGYLTRIDYGQRHSTLFTKKPLAQVVFKTDERCFQEGQLTCSEGNFTSEHSYQNRIWYDTPTDLRCEAEKECYVPTPTFWTRKRLAKVTSLAQRVRGDEEPKPVDSWTLGQTLPRDRTDEGTALWLSSISRTGYGTDGSTKTLNAIEFLPNTEPMPNRVVRGSDDPRPLFDRLRIQRIVNEYGGETLVKYSKPTGACATGSGFPKPSANQGLCYPAYWHPDPDKADESIEWFHKYVVEQVQELPSMVGVPVETTSYEYVGDAAWALNQSEFSKKKTRTYDQWRGFEVVRTVTGATSSSQYTSTQSGMSETRFFRGMDGDPILDDEGKVVGKKSVELKDSAGQLIATDHLAYQGRVAESLTYSKKDGEVLTRSVDVPNTPQILGSRGRDGGVPDLYAYRVTTDHTVVHSRTSGALNNGPSAFSTVRTDTTYEQTYGLPTKVQVKADASGDGQGMESCTTTSYVHNTDKNLIGLANQTLTTAGLCSEAASATAEDWMGGARTAYDNGKPGDTPTHGMPTTTYAVSGEGGGWVANATFAYDAYGRATVSKDAEDNEQKVTYDPAEGQVYGVVTTNALGHSSSQKVDPGRGTALSQTDANGHTTHMAYDPLGRTTMAWESGRSTSLNPSVRYEYSTRQGEPVHITTYTLARGAEDTGLVEETEENAGEWKKHYRPSVVFYDGLGRERQRQVEAVGGGRLITDTLYSEAGTVKRTNNAYFAEGSPSGEIFDYASETEIQNATLYAYDGLGRVVSETPKFNGDEDPAKASRYEYGYTHSTVVEPAGGTSQRSHTDALGRTVKVDTFTDALRANARTMTYEYDARGYQVKAQDKAGNVWSWDHDARGRVTTATDPDTGTTKTTYDDLDRPVTTTDARGVTVHTSYDELSRPIDQHLVTDTGELGEQLTHNEYDTALGGLGLPKATTRYTDGLGYTLAITSYNQDYQPTGQTLSLPPQIADAYGFEDTYTYTYEYTKTGELQSMTLPKAGTLDTERVITRYNQDGLPVSTSGLNWYASDVAYDSWGQVVRSVAGEHGSRVWTTNLIDAATGALTRQDVNRESTSDGTGVLGGRVNSRTYEYDPAGNILEITDKADTRTDRQCFVYDGLGQLTEAWTSPNVGCKPSNETLRQPQYSSGTTNVTAAERGYWHSYTYDELGNRKKLVEHDPGLNTAKDVTTDYHYGDPADRTKQPHTLTSMDRTYTSGSSQIVSRSTVDYDAAGNTTTRVTDGDTQTIDWTWDGKVASVTGFGDEGSGEFVNTSSGLCLDLSNGSTTAGNPLQVYGCNGTKPQKFRLDPKPGASAATGALKVVDHCVVPKDGATADGTPVVIAACSGTAAQEWTATSAGQLKHVSSGKCLTTPATAAGTDLQLKTCTAGAAGQVWDPADKTRYIYGPGGQRLISVSDSGHSLHLGETTVATTAGGAAKYTERYYTQPGTSTVMRHAEGTAKDTLQVLVADQNGSSYVSVELAQGNRVQFSKTTPFGAPRSESSTWASHRGYVGGERDASGLVHLGAREYDPTTGRFISADPILDLADPVQSNGYVYCENNPVTYADPTGLTSADDFYEGPSDGEIADAKTTLGTTIGDIILSVGWAVFKEFVGWNDIVSCFGGRDMWACGSLLMDAIPWTSVFSKGKKIWNAVQATISAIDTLRKAQDRARKLIAQAKAAQRAAEKAAAAAKEAAKRAAQAAKKKAKAAQESVTRSSKRQNKQTGNATQKEARAEAKDTAGTGRSTTARRQAEGGDSDGHARQTNEGEAASASGSTPPCHSFLPGTKVLLADGTTKPIEDIQPGDEVTTTDTETDESTTREVAATISTPDDTHFTELTIRTEGGEEKLTATDTHPFWVPELDEWVEAGDLKKGQWLRTSAGTHVQITAINRHANQPTTAHDLTVNGIHAYYVLAGSSPVLVHNCDASVSSEIPTRQPASVGSGGAKDYRDTFFKANPGLKASDYVVHHAIERQVLKKYPGLFTADELNSLPNLRGIPKSANSDLHLSRIRVLWNGFYKTNPNATRQQVMDHATFIDDFLGGEFVPRIR